MRLSLHPARQLIALGMALLLALSLATPTASKAQTVLLSGSVTPTYIEIYSGGSVNYRVALGITLNVVGPCTLFAVTEGSSWKIFNLTVDLCTIIELYPLLIGPFDVNCDSGTRFSVKWVIYDANKNAGVISPGKTFVRVFSR